jgi:hypothetical protein
MFQQWFSAEESLLSDSNNNEHLIIYLATVRGRRNAILPPAQSRTVVGNTVRHQSLLALRQNILTVL